MFSLSMIENGLFAKGAYAANGKLNGMQAMIMESQVKTDTLIIDFKNAIRAGKNPNDVIDEIFELEGIHQCDLTDFDKKRLMAEVENFYQSYRG